jgi:hypothetical protein
MAGLDALGSFRKTPAEKPKAKPKKKVFDFPELNTVANTEQSASTDPDQAGFTVNESKLKPSILLAVTRLSTGDKAQLNLTLNKEVLNDVDALC